MKKTQGLTRTTSRVGATSLRVALLLLVTMVPAHAADAADAGGFWPIWGSAALQVAVTVVGGLVLTGQRRTRDLESEQARTGHEAQAVRLATAERHLDELRHQLALTREEYTPRSETNSRFTRFSESTKEQFNEVRREFSEVRREMGEVRRELGELRDHLRAAQTDTREILELLRVTNG